MKSRYNPVLLAVIVIGLVCALWLNYSRYEIEVKKQYRRNGYGIRRPAAACRLGRPAA